MNRQTLSGKPFLKTRPTRNWIFNHVMLVDFSPKRNQKNPTFAIWHSTISISLLLRELRLWWCVKSRSWSKQIPVRRTENIANIAKIIAVGPNIPPADSTENLRFSLFRNWSRRDTNFRNGFRDYFELLVLFRRGSLFRPKKIPAFLSISPKILRWPPATLKSDPSVVSIHEIALYNW